MTGDGGKVFASNGKCRMIQEQNKNSEETVDGGRLVSRKEKCGLIQKLDMNQEKTEDGGRLERKAKMRQKQDNNSDEIRMDRIHGKSGFSRFF